MVGAGTAVALAGCSGDGNGDGSGGGGGTTTQTGEWPDLTGQSVHYLTPDTNDATVAFWEDTADAFTEATNADVNLEFAGFGDEGMIPRLTQLLQARNPPEVVDMGLTPAAGHLGQDVFAPLNDVVQNNIDEYGEPPSAKLATIDGDTYNMPFKGAGIQTFWYRSDLADTTPDSWENLRAYVQEVDEADNDIRGTYVPAATGQHALLSHMMYAWSNDTHLATVQDGQVVSNLDNDRDGWLEVLNMLSDMQQYSPEATDSSYGTMVDTIQTQQTASTSYSGARPKNQAIYNDRDFAEDIDTVIIPDNGGNKVMTGGGSLWALQGANVEAAKTFMEFVTSRDRYIQHFNSVVPVHNSCPYPDLATSDDYWDSVRGNAPDPWTDEQIERYQIEIFDYEWTNLLTETEPLNTAIGSIMAEGAVTDMVTNVLIDGADPGSELDNAHQRLNEVMDENL